MARCDALRGALEHETSKIGSFKRPSTVVEAKLIYQACLHFTLMWSLPVLIAHDIGPTIERKRYSELVVKNRPEADLPPKHDTSDLRYTEYARDGRAPRPPPRSSSGSTTLLYAR